jgi:hypothetical protein
MTCASRMWRLPATQSTATGASQSVLWNLEVTMGSKMSFRCDFRSGTTFWGNVSILILND